MIIRRAHFYIALHNSHVVFGRVTSKSAVRTYGSSDGRVFNFVIMDDSASVLVKAFNRNCDRVFASIVLGGVRFS